MRPLAERDPSSEPSASRPDANPGGSFLGFPLEGFGLFTSLLLAISSGFLAFFTFTVLAIFGLMAWNMLGHHSVDYAISYRLISFPAALAVEAVALVVFGALWVKTLLRKMR